MELPRPSPDPLVRFTIILLSFSLLSPLSSPQAAPIPSQSWTLRPSTWFPKSGAGQRLVSTSLDFEFVNLCFVEVHWLCKIFLPEPENIYSSAICDKLQVYIGQLDFSHDEPCHCCIALRKMQTYCNFRFLIIRGISQQQCMITSNLICWRFMKNDVYGQKCPSA